jgi:hypothetical protein
VKGKPSAAHTYEGSGGSGGGVGGDHHYTAAHFGQILSKCMALTHRSCPSGDVGGAALSAKMLNNISSGGKGLYQCNGRAAVHQFSLEPPLALALSVGELMTTIAVVQMRPGSRNHGNNVDIEH